MPSITANQLSNLTEELVAATGLTRSQAEEVIRAAAAMPAFVVPFNTSGMPLLVSGNLASGFPAGGTMFNVHLASTGIEQTIATVNSGKTAYVVGFSYTDSAAALAGLRNNAGTDIIRWRIAAGTSAIDFGNISGPIAVYTSTQAIKVISGTATGMFNIRYIEI